MNPAWAYRVESLGSVWRGARPEELEALLNEASADGWEPVLLTAHATGPRMTLVLRRPTDSRPQRRPRQADWDPG